MADGNITLKHTISVKQRTEAGDEVFVSVGMEQSGISSENVDTVQGEIDTKLSDWMEQRVAAIGGSVFSGYAEEADYGDEEEAEDDEEEAEEDEDEADEEEGDEDLPSVEEIEKMKKADLDALIDAYELEVDKKAAIKDKRAAIIAALFDEEDEEDEDEEDEDEEEADEDEEDEEEGDEEEEEFVPYTKAELSAMKLAEIQAICEEWEIKVKVAKGADLKAKKAAYIAAVLKMQEEAEEE